MLGPGHRHLRRIARNLDPGRVIAGIIAIDDLAVDLEILAPGQVETPERARQRQTITDQPQPVLLQLLQERRERDVLLLIADQHRVSGVLAALDDLGLADQLESVRTEDADVAAATASGRPTGAQPGLVELHEGK